MNFKRDKMISMLNPCWVLWEETWETNVVFNIQVLVMYMKQEKYPQLFKISVLGTKKNGLF